MIDAANKRIYVDYSTLAKWMSCKEETRLGSVLGYRLQAPRTSLAFGHAFHAAIAAYYDALAGGYHVIDALDHTTWMQFPKSQEVNPLQEAQAAFLRDLKIEGNADTLPTALDSSERRSIERGLGMIEAYIFRWRNEPYDNLLSPEGEPYTEIGFKYPLGYFEDYELMYVGRIDRLMVNRVTNRPVIFETKTTSMALSQYILSCKPNHQITGYFPGAQAIAPAIREAVWDCAFVSTRQADMKRALRDAERFMMYGVDVEKDFTRVTTSRSPVDIHEFRRDAEELALDYCKWLTSGAARWPRSAPTSCHRYGGCAFRGRCSMNFTNQEDEAAYMNTYFKVEKWEPWKRLIQEESDAT